MSQRHSVLVLVATMVALTACGSDDPGAADTLPEAGGLRPPTPIEAVEGAASAGTRGWAPAPVAESSTAAPADAMTMLAPVELVLGDVGELPTATTGYVLPAGAEVSAETVGALAAVLGVSGEPVAASPDTGMAWQVGPTDGTAPSLTVSASAPLSWWYQGEWVQPVETPACMPTTTVPGAPSVGAPTIDPCPAPEPPAGVPTAAEAEERSRQLLADLGVDLDLVQLEANADEWFAGVEAAQVLDGVPSPLVWSFAFGPDGVLQYANGTLASPEPVGPYPLLDLDAAFTRLQELQTGTWGGFGRDMLATEAVPAPDATSVTVPPPALDTPVSASVDPMAPPASYPPGSVEPVVVTLVDVEADQWWVTDVDGSVWLLPAYRFIGDDGGWYTVPAVTDEYLIVVEPELVPPPNSLPPAPSTAVSVSPTSPLPVPTTQAGIPPTSSLPVPATELPESSTSAAD